MAPTVKPVRRHQKPAQTLMGALIVVVLNPPLNGCSSFVGTGEMLTPDELSLQVTIAGLNLAQGLRMMGPSMGVVDPFTLQIPFKPVGTAPGVEDKSTVGKHLLHLAIAGHCLVNQTNDCIDRGLCDKTNAKDEPGKIVQEQQQVHLQLIDIELDNVHLHQLERTARFKPLTVLALGPSASYPIAIGLHDRSDAAGRYRDSLTAKLIPDLARSQTRMASPGGKHRLVRFGRDLLYSTVG